MLLHGTRGNERDPIPFGGELDLSSVLVWIAGGVYVFVARLIPDPELSRKLRSARGDGSQRMGDRRVRRICLIIVVLVDCLTLFIYRALSPTFQRKKFGGPACVTEIKTRDRALTFPLACGHLAASARRTNIAMLYSAANEWFARAKRVSVPGSVYLA